MVNELCAPPDVENDPNAVEILRIWVAEGVLQLSVDISVYESVEDYGVLLAGLGNHYVNAMTIGTGKKKDDVLAALLKKIGQKYKSFEQGVSKDD